MRDCSNEGPGGTLVCTCQPTDSTPTLQSVTGQPQPTGTDVCGAWGIAVPASLDGMGCTTGRVIDGQVVWACNNATPPLPYPPPRLVQGSFGPCFTDATNTTPAVAPSESCELLRVEPTIKSNCLGAPLPGWQLVADEVTFVEQEAPQSCTNCFGGASVPPFAN